MANVDQAVLTIQSKVTRFRHESKPIELFLYNPYLSGQKFFHPGTDVTGFFITEGVVVLAAVLIILLTRGRLSYTPNQEMNERRN